MIRTFCQTPQPPGNVFVSYLTVAVMLWLTACKPAAAPDRIPSDNTARMATLLEEAYAAIDPMEDPYLSATDRLALFDRQRQTGSPGERLRAHYLYCKELLNAGNSSRAIVELEAFVKKLEELNIDETQLADVQKLLATAYLRLGEEENCLSSHNPASCIVPFEEEGYYTMTNGPRNAIRICKDLLEKHPNDYEARWMLNFAYMTIGEYPHSVPEQWRLRDDLFDSDHDLSRFNDIAHRVGIRGQGLAGGCSVDDFDGDGLLDIIASSWGREDPPKYYVNNGQGGFEDRSGSMHLDGITGGLNLLHADYNNDGWLDFVVLRGAWLSDNGKIPNSLIRNNGDGTFSDVTIEAGVLTYAPTQTAVWADFNRDGWIDLFVGNESTRSSIYPCEFYLNNGDGTFRNVIDQIGLPPSGYVKGCAAGDFNNDMWPDLYVSYYSGPNKLLKNKGVDQSGNLHFEEVAGTAGVSEPEISFPTWFWDFNNDGWEDLFVSGYGVLHKSVAESYALNALGQAVGGHPRLYINNGNGTFTDASPRMGLTDAIYTMGSNFGDLDNDGFLDMFLGTGDPDFKSIVPNKMYRNRNGQGLQDVTTAGGFGHVQKGHGIGFGDFDQDGDEDIFQVIGGAYKGDLFENALYENPTSPTHAWTVLRLVGIRSNRAAIGARLKITVSAPDGEHRYHRTVTTGGSFGASSLQVELGLGNATHIKEMIIHWPNEAGTTQRYLDLPVNACFLIIEGNDTCERVVYRAIPFGK